MNCRIVATEEEFERLGPAWDALLDDAIYPNFFHKHDWLTTWWKWFGRRLGTLHVLVVENDDSPPDDSALGDSASDNIAQRKLVAALPLWKSGSRLRPLGYDGTTCPEYPGLIVRKHGEADGQTRATTATVDGVVDAIVGFFVQDRSWNEIHFEDYAVEDPGTAALVAAFKNRFPAWSVRGDDRYYIALPESYDAYLATRSAHNRQKKRTRLRKAINSFHAEAVALDAESIDDWFPRIAELSALSLGRKGCATPWNREDFAGFHKELMLRLLPKGEARVFFLRCDDGDVAFRYGFAYEKKFYGYQTACDPAHPSRAGDTLTQMVLIELIREGFLEFDFLRGLEDYKTLWTDTAHETESARFFRTRNRAYWARVLFEHVVRPLGRRVKRFLLSFQKRS